MFEYSVLLVILLSSFTSSEPAPDFIQPCQELTPDCLKDSIQKAVPYFVDGFPEWGIGSLDPLSVDRLQLSMPGGLKMLLKNGRTKGFKQCLIESARFDNDIFRLNLRCNLTARAQYQSRGRLLLFRINGDGDAVIHCNNMKIMIAAQFETRVDSDGRKHFHVKNYSHKALFDGRVTYNLTNLFQGNPEISKAVLNFMNANWRMVAEEFGKPLVDYGVKSVVENVNKFFKIIPLENLTQASVNF